MAGKQSGSAAYPKTEKTFGFQPVGNLSTPDPTPSTMLCDWGLEWKGEKEVDSGRWVMGRSGVEKLRMECVLHCVLGIEYFWEIKYRFGEQLVCG